MMLYITVVNHVWLLVMNVLVNLNIRTRRSNSQFWDLSKPSGFRHQLDHISVCLPQPAEPVRNEPVLSVITNRYQYSFFGIYNVYLLEGTVFFEMTKTHF